MRTKLLDALLMNLLVKKNMQRVKFIFLLVATIIGCNHVIKNLSMKLQWTQTHVDL